MAKGPHLRTASFSLSCLWMLARLPHFRRTVGLRPSRRRVCTLYCGPQLKVRERDLALVVPVGGRPAEMSRATMHNRCDFAALARSSFFYCVDAKNLHLTDYVCSWRLLVINLTYMRTLARGLMYVKFLTRLRQEQTSSVKCKFLTHALQNDGGPRAAKSQRLCIVARLISAGRPPTGTTSARSRSRTLSCGQ